MHRCPNPRGRIRASLLMAVLVAGCTSEVDDTPIGDLHLIPVPTAVSGDRGHLHLTEDSRVVVTGDVTAEAELLAEVLRRSTGYTLEVVDEPPSAGDIALVLDATEATLGDEGYRIEVDAEQATVTGATAAGVFYGCQTLRQLLPPEVESGEVVDSADWAIPMVTVEDQPRFGWRGFMLDVARHFFTVEEVMGLIDVAAHYKLNRFHLHLTDDQGWRLEIMSWPDLTTLGGASEVGGGEGGWYTQADYEAIVEYAAARHMIVVPEIDMPGHCNAALASYGELNADGQPTEPYDGTEVGFSSLWLDGEITLQFVEEVFAEVAALTPGPYLHIGGDEAHETDDAAYAEFIGAVQSIVADQGKTMVGWEEIGNGPLTTPVVAQYWHDEAPALAAAGQGAQIIASPATHAYLDMIYDLDSHVGTLWAGSSDVEDAYSWDPLDGGLAGADVIGIEAPLWTETTDLFEDVQFLVFPRLLGHAEIGWSPVAGRSWAEYRIRLAHHGPRMELRGLAFYRSPLVDWVE
jgi:hexosaminidase